MAQSIAAIILAHPAQIIQHAPIGQHHFKPQYQVPRIAPANGANAARIGGKRAAHHGRALRAPGQREKPARCRRGFLYILDDTARFSDQRKILRIHIADTVEPFQAHDHCGRAIILHHRPAAKPGAPAGGHNGKPGGGAGADGCRNLLNRARAQHGARRAAIGSAPIHRVRGDIGILNEAILRPHDRGEQFGSVHGVNTSPVMPLGQTGFCLVAFSESPSDSAWLENARLDCLPPGLQARGRRWKGVDHGAFPEAGPGCGCGGGR